MREPSQDSILPTPIPEKQKGSQLLSVLVASLPILPSFLLVVILFLLQEQRRQAIFQRLVLINNTSCIN